MSKDKWWLRFQGLPLKPSRRIERKICVGGKKKGEAMETGVEAIPTRAVAAGRNSTRSGRRDSREG